MVGFSFFREKRKRSTEIFGALLLLCVLGSGASGLPEKRSECPYGDYLSKNGICCQRCPPGYKREKDCEAVGNRTSCTRCPKGQYNEHENYSDNCRSCQTCQYLEEEVTECTPRQNTKCRCKNGYYKDVIDSSTSQCLECSKCGHGEHQSEKSNPKDINLTQVVMISLCVAVVLLLAVGFITYTTTKRHTRSQMGRSTVNPPEDVHEESAMVHFTLLPGLIYSMLSLVPAHRVKELVRCLGVTDLEIERAEIDYHTCKEAHYQMLRVWAERGSRGGEAGRGGGVLHRPLMQQLLDRLSDMHLGGALEELKAKYGIVSGQVGAA
uniref:Tumor necrosis factor receptor superfamily, member 1a n=1 Tax=Gadus morhua TaxID=8049 RepID=A0A8C5D443_GADMO